MHDNGMIKIQDLLQEMGKEIVHEESPKKLGNRSRLWKNEDVLRTLKDDNLIQSLPAESEFELYVDGGGSLKIIFVNCLKLNQKAVSNVFAESLLKMQVMVTEKASSLFKDIPFRGNCGIPLEQHEKEVKVSICLPGSEIPEWFSYQNSGSSINIPAQHDCGRRRYIMGFALCLVIGFEECYFHPHNALAVHYDFHIENSDGHKEAVFHDSFPLFPVCMIFDYRYLEDHAVVSSRDSLEHSVVISNFAGPFCRLTRGLAKRLICYDGLDAEEKDLFLDIACFGTPCLFESYLNPNIVSDREFSLSGLNDKSLVTMHDKDMIQMHDLLREMGREIVHEESPKKPRNRSKLWKNEDVLCILKDDNVMATEKASSLFKDIPFRGNCGIPLEQHEKEVKVSICLPGSEIPEWTCHHVNWNAYMVTEVPEHDVDAEELFNDPNV
ncbi:hypothetical protein JRO89_XS07G0279700 [Xanthoceras sorbifolium]|uniref:Uncharacterized protein n=1 Tax=Xanthoceras sorbifolium TaxID=99658 RepID=A0ABQ8HVG3_9ROSI|nr:hypothetical protein JRO89_XS07G0279700 [Xanthoceras sorbifolium]